MDLLSTSIKIGGKVKRSKKKIKIDRTHRNPISTFPFSYLFHPNQTKKNES